VRAALKDVSPMEQVKKIAIVPQPFSVAGDELTVSLKLRRNVVVGKYVAQIEQMYRE
jgi:long-chain acyl-CoA synthetase